MRTPSPKGDLLTGHLRSFFTDQLGFLTMCAREYGDVVRLRFLHLPVFLLSHPDDIEQVLMTNNNFIRSRSVRLPLQKLVFGNGLLASEGPEWLVRRRQLQQSAHSDGIPEFAGLILNYTERLLAEWDNQPQRDLYADIKSLSLAIAAKLFFGVDSDSRFHSVSHEVNQLTEMLRVLGARGLVHHYLPTKLNRRFKQHARRIDQTIYRMIDSRRREPQANDLLSVLLCCHNVDGVQLTDNEIRDEVMTLFLAGHETTAIGLSWTLYLLTQHPEVESRLFDELRSVLNGRPPEAADMAKLKFTQTVIKESLRLYPPNRTVGRETLRACKIRGHQIPARSQLIMSQWVVHRDDRFFPDPLAFKPERWQDPGPAAIPKYAYFPFGGGQRMCLGKSIALMEMTLVLATIVQQFQMTLAADSVVEPAPDILLRPGGAITAFTKRRKHAARAVAGY